MSGHLINLVFAVADIKYIQGNAKQIDFLEDLLSKRSWDCIVDFMVHTESNLKVLLPKILNNTKQYIFISSARVYSQSEIPITEDTPRLLDVSTDKEYLKTNEYALAKAREENLLFNSGKKNFTIIRPSITYNTHRLQLGVLEKENWLYRALQGRGIVFSEDLKMLTSIIISFCLWLLRQLQVSGDIRLSLMCMLPISSDLKAISSVLQT